MHGLTVKCSFHTGLAEIISGMTGQDVQYGADVLVADHAENNSHLTAFHILKLSRDVFKTSDVVARVANSERFSVDDLPTAHEACQTGHLAETFLNGFLGDVQHWLALRCAQGLEFVDGAEDGVGVLDLIDAFQLTVNDTEVFRDVVDAAIGAGFCVEHLTVLFRQPDGGTHFLCLVDEHRASLFDSLAYNHRYSQLDDASFLHGDFIKRVAQHLGMVVTDVGDDRNQRMDNVGAVETTTQAHFYNGDIHSLVSEVLEGHGGGQLEEGGVERLKEGTLVFHEIDDLLLTTDEEIAKVMAVNVGGTANIIKHALPVLESQKSGNMVIISSITARDGGPANQIYCASKAAVTSLIQSASKMAAPFGVRVNGILPGIIYTDMWDDILLGRAHNGDPNDTRPVSEEEKKRLWEEAVKVIPLGRAQKPRDISWSTAFLASDFAREITGQCLCIDGGMTSGN